jgi:DNA-binding protein H-NS
MSKYKEALLEQIDQLIDAIEERDEKQEFFEKAKKKGEAEEADSIYETIAEIDQHMEQIKRTLIHTIELTQERV